MYILYICVCVYIYIYIISIYIYVYIACMCIYILFSQVLSTVEGEVVLLDQRLSDGKNPFLLIR
jgi:hypothetical protein